MLLVTSALFGQTKAQKQAGNYDKAARATVLHDANVYVAADADAQKISLVTPGHEVVIIERNGPWVKVFANTDINDDANEDDRNKPEFSDDANVTPASGWIRDKGVVGNHDAEATRSLGSAANFEDEAEHPHAPKGAAGAAHLLYKRVTEYFPDSPWRPKRPGELGGHSVAVGKAGYKLTCQCEGAGSLPAALSSMKAR